MPYPASPVSPGITAHTVTASDPAIMGSENDSSNWNRMLRSYNPTIYDPELRENLRNNTILTRICNSEFKGKFHNKGEKIKVRRVPLVSSRECTDDTAIQYDDPQAYDIEMTINRARYFGFLVRDFRTLFSDKGDQSPTWAKEGAIDFAEKNEKEFFRDVWTGLQYSIGRETIQVPNAVVFNGSTTTYGGAHEKNMGNAAGAVSGIYKLGTASSPVDVYKLPSEAAASSATVKSTMVDHVATTAATLLEQPGSQNLTRPWIVLPVAAGLLIQTSELKDASFAGDPTTLLRKGVLATGSLAGLDIYYSNLLPVHEVTAAEAAASGATVQEGDRIWPCLFGDMSAICYADEVNKTEMGRCEDKFAYWHRSYMVYDFLVKYPERLGLTYLRLHN